jgi:hypothetical protein
MPDIGAEFENADRLGRIVCYKPGVIGDTDVLPQLEHPEIGVRDIDQYGCH